MHAPRVFSMWVLGLCTRGYMYMSIEGVEYKIVAGDMFLLPPNSLHRGTKMGKEGVSYYWIHFLAPDIDVVQREMDFSETPEGNRHSYMMLHYPLLNIQKASTMCDYLYSLDYGTQYTEIIRQNLLKVLLYEISNQTLLGYAQLDGIEPDRTLTVDDQGNAAAEDLTTGLYLIAGERLNTEAGSYTCTPMVLPMLT